MSARILPILACAAPALVWAATPLGLPPVPVPADNPQTPEKIALGEKLYNDVRFSSTGQVSCASCHDPAKAFTDSPLRVSEGIDQLTGTRNAPTVLNAAYMDLQFWDGREPSLESQSQQPIINPVEMGLKNHDPVLEIVRSDPAYRTMFDSAFGLTGSAITMTQVSQAIAAFERTQISGNSPFDRWHFGGDESAVDDAVKRGFTVFLTDGRCVSCHTVSENYALFTDSRFHNINVGFPLISDEAVAIAESFAKAKAAGANVDEEVLSNRKASELGRYAVTSEWIGMGSFKTPTLRNIALTAPYMHDGSLTTLEDVVDHYNNGGKLKAEDPDPSGYLSGGIRPLELTDAQKADLVAFLESLTSPEVAQRVAQAQVDAQKK